MSSKFAKNKEGSIKDLLYDSNPSSDGENYDDDDFHEGENDESPEHVTPNHR